MTSAKPSVVAIIAAYNEADVIGYVVRDLLAQEVQVYFLDDGSTDGTVEALEPHVGHGVIAIERLCDGTRASVTFEWGRLLQRKAQLACELTADWFIHHDADEFRESPWPGVSVRDAIAHVDACGYNAVDFRRLDFWPTDDQFQPGLDVRAALPRWTEPAAYDRLQIRCWKKTSAPVDLVTSGGHEARFDSRRVFPIRFLLRHYPIRSRQHGERKIFVERRPRFTPSERALGWHIQYDRAVGGHPFLPEPSTLTPYDDAAVKLDLQVHHRTLEERERRFAVERSVLEDDLHEARARTDRLEASLTAQAGELERCRSDLVTTKAALVAETGRAEACVSRIAALEGDVSRRADELNDVRRVLSQTAARLDSVYRSRSWRWSAPARALFRAFGGRTT